MVPGRRPGKATPHGKSVESETVRPARSLLHSPARHVEEDAPEAAPAEEGFSSAPEWYDPPEAAPPSLITRTVTEPAPRRFGPAEEVATRVTRPGGPAFVDAVTRVTPLAAYPAERATGIHARPEIAPRLPGVDEAPPSRSAGRAAARAQSRDENEVTRLAPRSPPSAGQSDATRMAPHPGEVARTAEGTHRLNLADLVLVEEIPPVESDAAPYTPPPAADRDLTPPPGLVASPPARREGSVVTRLFKSVVTVLPQALKKTLTGAEPAKTAPPLRVTLTPMDEARWRRLRLLPILDGIPTSELSDAVVAGEVTLYERERDALVDSDDTAHLVVSGQIALAQFNREKLELERKAQLAWDRKDKKAAKKEAKRRAEAGPLIRLSERNLAFFEEGDLIHLRLGAARAPDGLSADGSGLFPTPTEQPAYGLYAVTPVTLIALHRSRLDAWQRTYSFFADRVRRASQSARDRIDAVVGARAEVADFFIRQGLSIALMLRVRQIDKCIECGECEKACEERYGAKRLSLGGRVLGGLDFVDACHTCSDQRCIDPCAFDAIKFDVAKKEVVIIEAACTGCTLCASACPYNAIEMHDLDEKPLLKLRLEREQKLAFGDGLPPLSTQFGAIKPRKAKLKRMASKCDHCIDYGDQACISACPTGALFDALPGDVFHARSASAVEAARGGFEHTAMVDVRALHDPRPFAEGIDAGEADKIDRARAARAPSWIAWLWMVGLGAWVLCLAEVLLRKLVPEMSVDFFWKTVVGGEERLLALSHVDYHPGCDMAVWVGSIGSLILFSGMLYPARRRLSWMKNLGSQRAWFEMHVLTGVVGPLFVLLHTAVKLDNWVSLAFWSMVLTVLSGLMGRYLFTQLGDKASAAGLGMLEAARRLDGLRDRHGAVRAVDAWFAGYQERVKEAAGLSGWRVIGWLFADELERLRDRLRLGRHLVAVAHPATRREAVELGMELARYERHRVLLPRIEPLFRRWKLIHVPAAITLSAIGGLHILLAIFAG